MKSRHICSLAMAVLTLALSGCVTMENMAFQEDSERLTDKTKPVLLMTATLRNSYKLSHQPKLVSVILTKSDGNGGSDRMSFRMDDKGRSETDSAGQGNRYLVRLQLDPGNYEILGLQSMSSKFPVIGSFFTPIHSTLTIKDRGVFYLGHVDATVRERKGEEFKAGSSIPLIDQAVVGASGGTFDVSISDNFSVDEQAFRSKFPALASATIYRTILPPFDRAKAQKWWEDH